MTQPEPAGGGSFEVDIARAPEAIGELEQARDELYSIRDEAQFLGHIEPPTRDQVSRDAAQLLGNVAVGGPASLQAALDLGISELTRLIDSLRSGFESYQESDEQSSVRFRQL